MIYVYLVIVLLPPVAYFSVVLVLSIYSILTKSKIQNKYRVESVDLASVSGLDYQLFEEIKMKMEKEGFIKSGDYFSTDNKTQMYIRTLKNLKEGIRFQILQAVSAAHTMRIMSLETEFEDGRSVDTTNRMMPSSFKIKGKKVYRHLIDSPEEILKKHRGYIRKLSGGREVSADRLQSDERDILLNGNEKILRMQEKYRILKFNKTEDCYSYTLYGAARTAAILLFYKLFRRPAVLRNRPKSDMVQAVGKQERLGFVHYLLFEFYILIIWGLILQYFEKWNNLGLITIMIGLAGTSAIKLIERPMKSEK